jgi:hypothetical protein
MAAKSGSKSAGAASDEGPRCGSRSHFDSWIREATLVAEIAESAPVAPRDDLQLLSTKPNP